MSQIIFDTIDPSISGTDLAGILNDFKDAMVSGMSGTTRPTELDPGGGWIDKTNDPTSWVYKVWTGVDDVEVFTIDLANGTASVALAVDSFIVRKVSADTVGAVMELVKRRIATNGQVLSGDVVGEVRMIGRDDVAGNPVVAKIIWEAAENMTATAFGGTLTFYSTPAGQAALVAHMRFIDGVLETLVPHKMNSQILVSQNVATAATIAQLSGAKMVVEMTGATATDIQGINSAHASKVVTIHNRSSAEVIVKNQDAGAIAADRVALPESRDIVLLPQDSVTLFYCTADSRWKVQYASARFQGFENDTVLKNVASWTAPATVNKVRISAHSRGTDFQNNPSSKLSPRIKDVGKSLYAWGGNLQGSLGLGDVVTRSSPVAVLGGLKFIEVVSTPDPTIPATLGLAESGDVYAWGNNNHGQLADGTVAAKSSPVAAVGGLKFKSISAGRGMGMGLSQSGAAYAWGINDHGQLGLGDVASRSSPVAVLGGLTFREIFSVGHDNGTRGFGITLNGDLYAWGRNLFGELGVGDITPRSSPVAVLGGLKFKTVFGNDLSTYGLTEAGVLYAWGLNDNGQLGVGNVVPRSSPVLVLGGLVFREVSTEPGNSFSTTVIGLTEAGVAYAWGLNANGELGVGDVIPRSSPVAVLGGLVFKKALMTDSTAVGLTEDGTAYAWGANDDGQVGDGTVVPKSSPVAVLGGLSFQDVYGVEDASGAAILGLSWDGKLYAWGNNFVGQLGVGDVVPRSSPVAVLSGLSLKTQDDSDTVLDIPVVGGNTYALRLGAGPCFFGNKPIGNNIQSVDITYIE